MCNRIHIRLKEGVPVSEMMERISGIYKGYRVVEPIDGEDIKRQVSDITVPFMLMAAVVAFMSTFIIYTSFKVITMERLPVIGTFRSIGATRKTADYIMLGESIIYGITGSGLGLGLGLLILRGMSEMMKTPSIPNMQSTVSFTPLHLVSGFFFGVVLCFLSSLIPIIQISKIPLKDIILNTMDEAVKKRPVKLVLGIACVAVSIVLPSLEIKSMAFLINIICMIASIAVLVMLIPFLTTLAVWFFQRIYVVVFGNVGVLAAKNLRENRSILNNISLLSIGISSLLLINIISYSAGVELANLYARARFDIQFSCDAMDERMERLLRTIDGVTDTTGVYQIFGVEANGRESAISTVMGIDYRKFFTYWNFDIQKGFESDLPKLEEERAIFLTSILKDRLSVNEGDYLSLKINNRERKYKVAGFFNSLYNNGSIALIADKYFKLDTGENQFSTLYIMTDEEPEPVAERINKEMSRYYPWTETLQEMEENNRETNEQMFVILQGFSLTAMLIGIIGVINNLLISFIQRKRQLAVFRSIGMDKGQTVKMVLIEAFTGGLIGGTVGVLAGLLLVYIVEFLMVTMHAPIAMHYHSGTIFTSGIAGLVIMLAASVAPSVRSSRLNIIEAIQYE